MKGIFQPIACGRVISVNPIVIGKYNGKKRCRIPSVRSRAKIAEIRKQKKYLSFISICAVSSYEVIYAAARVWILRFAISAAIINAALRESGAALPVPARL
jgi:hypothetical protein